MINYGRSSMSSGSDVSKSVLNILCKKDKGLKVCHFNAQSLLPKVDEFQNLFNSDFILVSETWFNSYTPSCQISLPKYKLFRKDRLTHGGGVAIYVRENISARLVGTSSAGSAIEFIFVEIRVGCEKCLIGCVYKPPKVTGLAGTELEAFLNHSSHLYNYICVGGDFNINLLEKKSSTETFVDFVKSFGLCVVNSTFPTHFTLHSSTLLDLFLVSDQSNVNRYDQISVPAFSKHDMIFLSINILPVQQSSKAHFYYDFSKVDLNSLLYSASTCDWNIIYSQCSVNDQVESFNRLVHNLFETFIPMRTRRRKKRSCP